MEVSGKNITTTLEAYASKVQETKKPVPADREKEQPSVKGDTVSLSREAREVASITQKLEETPDVREDKVTEIQEKIESGTYNVDGQKAANGLMMESLINELV
ncbi:MAG: flagellar biosynthesis anti-sigma factor FlgM [Desulfobacterales bacterium]|nr:flagellar biosynthesis anti-sigma factor FlgM [Desulfobacterales bacterium]